HVVAQIAAGPKRQLPRSSLLKVWLYSNMMLNEPLKPSTSYKNWLSGSITAFLSSLWKLCERGTKQVIGLPGPQSLSQELLQLSLHVLVALQQLSASAAPALRRKTIETIFLNICSIVTTPLGCFYALVMQLIMLIL